MKKNDISLKTILNDFEKEKENVNNIIINVSKNKNNQIFEIDINSLNQNISKIEKDFKTEINQTCTKRIEHQNLVQLKPLKMQKQQRPKQQYNNVDWKFNYFCDRSSRGKSVHGIYDNGKTFQCKYDSILGCQCFSRVSFGMKPNSGKYKIKFKINKINNKYIGNAIGITCNTHKTNNSQHKYNYWFFSHEYIAWSSWDSKGTDHKNVPNGLICGRGDDYQPHNIFVLSKFQYMSNNNSHLKRLPPYKSGDIIELQYDSNNNSLSFLKSNDLLLNSTIINLPKDKAFYWIVGHNRKEMSVTILG